MLSAREHRETAKRKVVVQEGPEHVAEQETRATAALSGLFARLARERARHERETQTLQQRLQDLTQELEARKARDQDLDAQVRPASFLKSNACGPLLLTLRFDGRSQPYAGSGNQSHPRLNRARALLRAMHNSRLKDTSVLIRRVCWQ